MNKPDSERDDEPSESPSTPPPPEAVSWVEGQLDDRIVAVEALPGGISSSIHRLTLERSPEPVVLRRYTAEWVAREPQIPHDEATTLTAIGSLDLGVSTPLLLAADPDGRWCDAPAVLMTAVDGAPDIDPVDPIRWAERLAVCLSGIHRAPIPYQLAPYRRWDRPGRPVPAWTAEPELWPEAAARLAGPLPDHPSSLIHRDYHPCNIHWRDAEICAVVDWLGACVGPIAADLAHCRWNLAILTEPSVAERFTDHYRTVTGYSEDVTPYDLSTILSGPLGPFPAFAWNALGRHDLTSETVAPKIDRWLAVTLEA